MNFDVIVFDFDGTVAESGRGIMKSAASALERLGREVPGEDVLRKFVGPPLYTSFVEYCSLTPEEAERAIALYRERYSATGLFEADIYPGLTPLLKALKENGARVAVASGKPGEFLKRIIDHFGLSDCFDAVEGSDPKSHTADKSAQLRAVLPEGVDLSRVCMVGDRRFDVEAARALGVHAVGVAYGYGSRQELEDAGADFVADTVAELSDHLLGDTPRRRGRMISFEGTDGCGKSTQIRMLGEWLTSRGYEVTVTREPGGCAISERIREVILSLDSKGMSAECEALLYAAARIEHVREVILPALEAGKIVLCDRFLDSSIAYQAYGRELGEDFIRQINKPASDLVMPDCTLQLDIDRQAAKERLSRGEPLDRLETEQEEFFVRVAEGYERVARNAPRRVRRIDSGRSVEEVFSDVLAGVQLN